MNIKHSLNQLLLWSEEQNNKGYDPYDLLSCNEYVLSLQGNKNSLSKFKLYVRFFINLLNFYAPILTRKVLRINRLTHPTYMGCLMHTYLNLYKNEKKEIYLNKADFYRKWLLENTASGSKNTSWGTPFRWKSGSTIYELGTPFNVVTAWNASAFFKRYELFENPEDLKILESIYCFFSQDIVQSHFSDNTVCFSYSPIKEDYIHNANLFVAEFLVKYGNLTNNSEALNLGIKACKFTINRQLDNGLIPYFGKESKFFSEFNDSYHSSYELRMLSSIYSLTKLDFVQQAYEKYLAYYLAQYYIKGEIKLKKNHSGPTDVSSQADAILLFSQTQSKTKPDNHLEETIRYSLTHFQSKKGFFYYKKMKNGYMIKAPYIRWAQGWMALALSEALINSNE